jgi:hypothetical protein
MTWFWLRALDLLKPFYKWQGVDYDQLRAIVGVKLLMDNRRPFGLRQQQQKESSASVVYSMIFGAVIGLVMAMLIANVPSVIISFTVYHSMLIVMILLLLISDFSSVLLDTSDNTIVLPRPVSSKTFYAARTTHILVYIGQMGVSLSILPIAVTFFTYGGLVGSALIVTSLLCVILAVALTNGLYLLIMRFTSEERLKSIINYFQIFMTLFVMGGYQLLPRLLTMTDIKNAPASEFHWWAIFIPPMWMTGLIKLVHDFSFAEIDILLAALAVFAPVGIWKLITNYLTPYFISKLSDLGTGSSGVSEKLNKTSTKKSKLSLKTWITKAGLEQASYGLVWSALSHDRKLKLRIYPSLGSIIILILLPILRSENKVNSVQVFFASLAQTQGHLFAIYACIFALITVAYEIQFTDEFKAAWIYVAAPIEKPGVILSGALKAVLVKFFLPIYSIISAGVFFIWGSKSVVDLIFGAVSCILLMVVLAIIGDKRLPLSMAPTSRNQAGSFARAIISMLLIGLLGGGHYALSSFSFILWIACPLLMIACYLIWRLYANADWEHIEV